MSATSDQKWCRLNDSNVHRVNELGLQPSAASRICLAYKKWAQERESNSRDSTYEVELHNQHPSCENGSRGRIRTADLQVMGLTIYH